MAKQESFGGSSGDLAEKALIAIADFMQSVQPGTMVQKFVLLVESLDNEDRWLSAFTAPGQKSWDTLGLLAYATALDTSVVMESDEDE